MNASQVKTTLERDRAATLTQRDELAQVLDDIVAAATDVATDDEHDPEGSTIAYERSRTKAMIDQAADHLSEIALALERLEAGSYGRCVRCGGPIAPERLEARPVVRTCIACASR